MPEPPFSRGINSPIKGGDLDHSVGSSERVKKGLEIWEGPVPSFLQNHSLKLVIERKSHRRNLKLWILPTGELRIVCRRHISMREIFGHLEQFEGWIEKTWRRMQKNSRVVEVVRFEEGELFLHYGKKVPLNITKHLGQCKKPQIQFTDESILLKLPSNELGAAQLLSFFLKEQARLARREFHQRMLSLATKHQLFPSGLLVRVTVSRWGSCSQSGKLSLNSQLIGAPSSVIDSVILHELAHLKHPNHSVAFWDLLNVLDPCLEESESWLKQNGDALLLKRQMSLLQ